MKIPMIALVGLCAAACSTVAEPERKIERVEVKVPVAVSCVPSDLPPPPASYADDNLPAAAPASQRFLKTGEANLQRKARLAQLEPVVSACR